MSFPVRTDWQALLLRDYAAVAERLQQAYARMLPGLRRMQDALISEITRIEAERGEAMTAEQVRGLQQYRNLIDRVESELRDFAGIGRDAARGLEDSAVANANRAALGQLAEQAGTIGRSAELIGVWNQPDPAALERLINYVESDAFRRRYGNFATWWAREGDLSIGDGILSLVAQGKNPLQIARYISAWFNQPYAQIASMTRTVQLYSYRMASHAAYKTNERLVGGWWWKAALDARTCMSCIAQHGKVFGVDEVLNDHHQGRCTAVPFLRGMEPTDLQTGPQWFADQDERLWTAAAVRHDATLREALRRDPRLFGDVSRSYDDAIFGRMRGQATLTDLGIRPR